MVNKEGEIMYKSNHHKKGRQHDYTVYKDEQPQTPSQVENVLDLGYLGCEKDFPTVKYSLSIKKKKRNTVLTKEEKEYNTNHSRLRVIIEHTYLQDKEILYYGNQIQKQTKTI